MSENKVLRDIRFALSFACGDSYEIAHDNHARPIFHASQLHLSQSRTSRYIHQQAFARSRPLHTHPLIHCLDRAERTGSPVICYSLATKPSKSVTCLRQWSLYVVLKYSWLRHYSSSRCIASIEVFLADDLDITLIWGRFLSEFGYDLFEVVDLDVGEYIVTCH